MIRIGHQSEGVFESASVQRAIPKKSIAIHRNPSQSMQSMQSTSQSIAIHRNPSQSIAFHRNPSQSIAMHRCATQRAIATSQYQDENSFNYLISEGHRGGCWLCVAGVNYRPHGVRRVPLRLAGVGSTTSLPPQRGPSEISLRRSNYFQTPPL